MWHTGEGGTFRVVADLLEVTAVEADRVRVYASG